MKSIEKRFIIDINNLKGEAYLLSLMEEAYKYGLLTAGQMENIQLQCINFLADKCNRYNSGESTSVRIETAESIMKSNLYTMGLYLKSLPDAEFAVNELKKANIPEMYLKGRKIIETKFRTAKHLYSLILKNRLNTFNYSYNSTVSQNGIGLFFESYDADYNAHEGDVSIDYQLCMDVTNLTGVEFIQKYLENLLIENEFCNNFDPEDIHYLLCGYDKNYRDLLLNIFEQVLTAAIGCVLTNRSIIKLYNSPGDIRSLNEKLAGADDSIISEKINDSVEKIRQELNITSSSQKKYIEKCLPKITSYIISSIRTKTLGMTFVTQFNPDLIPKIEFSYGIKMEDEDYRSLLNELSSCRYLSDKLALIKERVKSFGDMEDLLLDAQLDREEILAVLGVLDDIEISALLKKHPLKAEFQNVELSEAEQVLRLVLKNYIDQLSEDRRRHIVDNEKLLTDQ